jgi:predicted NBD/HSP70 family sugar kinase
MTNAAARSRSLALAFERLLAEGTTTRARLVEQTGLSKATVARLVVDLEREGLAEAQQVDSDGRPGRRSTEIGVPRALGHTVGLSLGLRSCHAIALDLAGRKVGRRLVPTPDFDDADQAVAWAAEFIAGFSSTLDGCGPLLHLGVALPGRVRDGVPISALPEPLTVLAGHPFRERLVEALGVPGLLASDADMALAGVTSLGYLEPETSAVLFTMSTVLTVATRTRLGVVEARSSALGNFAALPLALPDEGPGAAAAPPSLGSLLSVSGISEHARVLDIELESTSRLWTSEAPEMKLLRGRFAAALAAAILVAAITTDPEACVLTGRLARLAAAVQPELARILENALDEPPRLVVTGDDDNGLTTALGCAHTALALEQRRFVDRVREGE